MLFWQTLRVKMVVYAEICLTIDILYALVCGRVPIHLQQQKYTVALVIVVTQHKMKLRWVKSNLYHLIWSKISALNGAKKLEYFVIICECSMAYYLFRREYNGVSRRRGTCRSGIPLSKRPTTVDTCSLGKLFYGNPMQRNYTSHLYLLCFHRWSPRLILGWTLSYFVCKKIR